MMNAPKIARDHAEFIGKLTPPKGAGFRNRRG
jgi:hypothetical protein